MGIERNESAKGTSSERRELPIYILHVAGEAGFPSAGRRVDQLEGLHLFRHLAECRTLYFGLTNLPIIGPRTLAQLKENLAAAKPHISAEHVARLDKVSALPLTFPLRRPRGCAPALHRRQS